MNTVDALSHCLAQEKRRIPSDRFCTPRWLTLLALLYVSPFGLFVVLDIPDRSSSSSSRLVQDVWDVYRDELGVVPDDVVLALGDAASRFCC